MKGTALLLVALLAVGCSGGTPMSPSHADMSSAAGSMTAASVPLVKTQKVMIYFYSDDLAPARGYVHIVGLPVTIVGSPSDTTVLSETGKQGGVDFTLPAADTSITVTTGNWSGLCGVSRTLELPLHTRDGWIGLHSEC